MRCLRRSDERGFLVVSTLVIMGIVSVLLGAYFAIITHEINTVTRATGRLQAFYLAEAGLSAANDLISQDWRNTDRGRSRFPMTETLAATVDGETTSLGDFNVTLTEINPTTFRLTSTGRSLALPDADNPDQVTYQVTRALSMVIVRRERPSFFRVGAPAALELEVEYFDKDGQPDLLVFSGDVEPVRGQRPIEGTLTAGSEGARAFGYHLVASFTDVDLDGDLDLVLSDSPSFEWGRDRVHGGVEIPAMELTSQESQMRPQTMIAADVLDSGNPISVLSSGWFWLPEGRLDGTEPGTDVFINTPVYDGTQIVSWAELP